MDNPPTSRADAAYERALAAYQDKSYDVARRWVLEALAHNRQHAGAKALLGRLDAARRPASPFETPPFGSEVVSTDPTVLVSRASGAAPPEPIEPTVMVRRDTLRSRPSDTDAHVAIPGPSRSGGRPVVDPTIIAQPKQRTPSSRPKSPFSIGGAIQSVGERLQTRERHRAASAPSRTAPARAGASWFATPAGRGAVIALATVAIGALLVWGAMGLFRWFFPAGQVLTITKPLNGTITGPGIECGTRGSDCSTTIRTGQPVELAVEADKGYVWSGYTGDCAPTGRTSMAGPRTCGATFQVVAAPQAPSTFRLTIAKPEGGTVVAAGGILCGAIGSTCSADIPGGAPVELSAQAADGFVFEQFNGDCPATGKTTMTSAMTCGAVFAKTSVPIANPGTARVSPPSPPVRRQSPPAQHTTPVNAPATSSPTGAVAPGTGTAPGGSTPTPAPTSPTGATAPPDKPVERPKTAEEHAKEEIQTLIANYCTQLQTLKPERIRALFNVDNQRELKDKFKEYKSLACSITSPPKYVGLDPSASGAAQVKFEMKQMVEMRSGGAPDTVETIVTMIVSRKDFQSPWLIDRVQHEPKPKS